MRTMGAPARLGLYGALLIAVFAVAFVAAGAVVPKATVQAWTDEIEESGEHEKDGHAGGDPADGTAEHTAGAHGGAGPEATGLALASNGYRLTDVSAPQGTGSEGRLELTVQGPDGDPVTDYEPSHEKELHLIVVRTDGAGFRHVHPVRDEDGQWSIPWTWDEPGSYRVYADFVPAGGSTTTLSTVVQVAGDVEPRGAREVVRTARSDGFEVSLSGDLNAGGGWTLTARVSRDGRPVTTLEPYLGAYGHLVALRDGDLAYLHVHPHGAEPEPDETSGPEVVFEVTAPTPGRYLLYLDFQVEGQVHTAEFLLDAAEATGEDAPEDRHTDDDAEATTDDHGHEEGGGDEHDD